MRVSWVDGSSCLLRLKKTVSLEWWKRATAALPVAVEWATSTLQRGKERQSEEFFSSHREAKEKKWVEFTTAIEEIWRSFLLLKNCCQWYVIKETQKSIRVWIKDFDAVSVVKCRHICRANTYRHTFYITDMLLTYTYAHIKRERVRTQMSQLQFLVLTIFRCWDRVSGLEEYRIGDGSKLHDTSVLCRFCQIWAVNKRSARSTSRLGPQSILEFIYQNCNHNISRANTWQSGVNTVLCQ